jgi:hypothetical protein
LYTYDFILIGAYQWEAANQKALLVFTLTEEFGIRMVTFQSKTGLDGNQNENVKFYVGIELPDMTNEIVDLLKFR